MDDLRIALVIAGIVVVAVVCAYARRARRQAAARRAEELEPASLESKDDWVVVPVARAPPEPGAGRAAADTDADVGGLGGMFTPGRETSDAELSVDFGILAGLRATYESTIDGTVDEPAAPGPGYRDAPDGPAAPGARKDGAVSGPPMSGRPEDGAGAESIADAGAVRPIAAAAARPLSVDMTRPLVYLTLVAKQERVSGRMVLESLVEQGFRPGLMRLYYWRDDAEPSVVFGAANMVEPGLLDPEELPGMETPGLVTFMSVPRDGATAFRTLNAMVAVSRRLARRIDAAVCDETRSTLTAQAENHLREKIADALRQDRIRD